MSSNARRGLSFAFGLAAGGLMTGTIEGAMLATVAVGVGIFSATLGGRDIQFNLKSLRPVALAVGLATGGGLSLASSKNAHSMQAEPNEIAPAMAQQTVNASAPDATLMCGR